MEGVGIAVDLAALSRKPRLPPANGYFVGTPIIKARVEPKARLRDLGAIIVWCFARAPLPIRRWRLGIAALKFAVKVGARQEAGLRRDVGYALVRFAQQAGGVRQAKAVNVLRDIHAFGLVDRRRQGAHGDMHAFGQAVDGQRGVEVKLG